MRARLLPALAAVAVLALLGAAGVAAAGTISGRFETEVVLPAEDDGRQDNEFSGASELRLTVSAEAGEAAGLTATLLVLEGFGSAAGEPVVGLDEAYVDLARGAASFRAGKQRVPWGSGYKVNPTSYVNPLDPEDPMGERQAVQALSAGYALGDLRFSAVLIPEFKPGLVVEQAGNPYDPSHPLKVATLRPAATAANAEYALKVTRRGMGGFDLSLSYFHGWEDYPSVRPRSSPLDLIAVYPAVDRAGVDAVGVLGPVGLWLEGAASRRSDGTEYTEAVAGIDYTTRSGLYLVGQYYLLSRDDPAALGEDRGYLMAVGRQTVGDRLTLQLSLVKAAEGEGLAVLPEAACNLADGTDLVLGLSSVREEGGDPLLERLGNQAYARVKLSF